MISSLIVNAFGKPENVDLFLRRGGRRDPIIQQIRAYTCRHRKLQSSPVKGSRRPVRCTGKSENIIVYIVYIVDYYIVYRYIRYESSAETICRMCASIIYIMLQTCVLCVLCIKGEVRYTVRICMLLDMNMRVENSLEL